MQTFSKITILLLIFSSQLLIAQSIESNRADHLIYKKQAKTIQPAIKAATTLPDPTPENKWDHKLINFGTVHSPKSENLNYKQIAKAEAEQIKLNSNTESESLVLNDTIGIKVNSRFRVNLGSAIPPDNTAAISNDGNIVSVVNSNICFAKEDGTIDVANQSLTTFYDELTNISSFIFDPKVLYDPQDDRFILVLLSGNNSNTSQVVVSFSSSSDPFDEWHHYLLDGDPSNQGIWTDFPSIGLSSEDFFISGNLFNDDSGFEETVIWQMDKDAGYAGEATIETAIFEDVEIPSGNSAFTIKPTVINNDSEYGPNYYMVCTRWGGNNIFLFEIDDKVENNPELSVFGLNPPTSYSFPPNGEQKGTDKTMDTGDIRAKSAFIQNNKVYMAFSSQYSSGNAGVYIAKVDLTDLSVESEIFGENNFDWGHPSIAPFGYNDTDETFLIGYLRTNSTIFPEMRALVVDANLNSTESVIIKTGESPITLLDGNSQRWGDYSFAFKRFNADTPTVWYTGCYGLNNGYGNFIAELVRVDNPQAIIPEFTANPVMGSKPLEVAFTDNSEGDNLSYFWEFEFGTPAYSTEQNPTVLFEQLGKFRIKLTINNGTDVSIVKEDYIEVIPNGTPPIANFTADVTTGVAPLTVQFTDISENEPEERLWQFLGASPSNSSTANPTVTYNNPGSFKVKLSVENEAGFDSKQVLNYIIVEDPTSTKEQENILSESLVYPNPISERFTVEFQLKEKMIISIDINNLEGKQIKHFFKERAKAGRNEFSFSAAPLKSGIYILKISDENGNVIKTEQLLVQ
jgi:PKD repeat protein